MRPCNLRKQSCQNLAFKPPPKQFPIGTIYGPSCLPNAPKEYFVLVYLHVVPQSILVPKPKPQRSSQGRNHGIVRSRSKRIIDHHPRGLHPLPITYETVEAGRDLSRPALECLGSEATICGLLRSPQFLTPIQVYPKPDSNLLHNSAKYSNGLFQDSREAV